MTAPPGEPLANNSTAWLAAILENNRRGKGVGVYSICSANRFVLEAGMMRAKRDGSLLLIESTSNQVNQFGGYTGQTPADFAALVKEIAESMDLPAERVVLGGDHLGPHVWRTEPSFSAMKKAEELVRACVLAGYTKIHLDASMHLADDSGDRHKPLPDEIVSRRAASLCLAGENVHRELSPGSPAPLYIIGTEVPIPGGELEGGQASKVTKIEHLFKTLQISEQAFNSRGLDEAWKRVIAVVVQPGVEFGDQVVFPYLPEKARKLSEVAEKRWHGVYEAHSTDYQSPTALRQMVRDHFAILKVGPSLTFAFREAVFALAAVEEEWLGERKGIPLSHVRETLETAMLADPQYWQSYYHGDAAALRFARKYSLSDRCRYYWPQPSVAAALQTLLANLEAHPAPISLLSQFLTNQAEAVRAGQIANYPAQLIRNKIGEVLDHYACACGLIDQKV